MEALEEMKEYCESVIEDSKDEAKEARELGCANSYGAGGSWGRGEIAFEVLKIAKAALEKEKE